MLDQPGFAAAIDAWHATAIGDCDWRGPLLEAERSLGATGVILHAMERGRPADTALIIASKSVPQESIESFPAFAEHDVRGAWAVRAPSGMLITDQEIGDPAALDRTLIYAELYRPFDLGRCAAIRIDDKAAIGLPGSLALFLNVLRANNSEAPDAEFRRRIHALANAAHSALRTAAAFSALRASTRASAAAIDALSMAVVFLGRQGNVMEANRAALGVFNRGDGLACTLGMLAPSNPLSRRALERALAVSVINRGRSHFVLVSRPGKRPYGLIVTPVPCDEAVPALAPNAHAVVFIIDPDEQVDPPHAAWRSAFHLTDAESDVAALLVQGLSYREIADRRTVSLETTRTQIKRLYAKLGVSNQTAAALLLARWTVVAPNHRAG